MHDPMTVAFEIPNPFRPRYEWATQWSQRPPLATIWHVDPEVGGDDDSCSRAYRYRKLNAQEEAISRHIYDAETLFGNKPHYPDSREWLWFEELNRLKFEWTKRRGFFRIPMRWHVWHWSVQVHPVQALKRWLFSRCCHCGKGFSWGYVPYCSDWNGTGPRWFKGEEHVSHRDCLKPNDDCCSGVGCCANPAAKSD